MSARRWMLAVLVCALAPFGGVLAWAAPAGAVVSQFGSRGEEAGQFNEVRSVAVDQATGDVYLYDSLNVRVDKFTAEGSFLLAWGWGVADGVSQEPQTCTTTCFRASGYGPSAGELAGVGSGVAVDNDPLSPSYEDVYVLDSGNVRVDKFSPSGAFLGAFGREVNEDGANLCLAGEKCRAGKQGKGEYEFETTRGAIAVDSNGDVFVGDHERVQVFSAEGVLVRSFAVSPEYPQSLAVDGAGNVYVLATQLVSRLAEYDASGAFVRTLDGEGNPAAVTVDPSGDVFVGNVSDVLEFGSGGEELASFDQEHARDDGGGGIAFGDAIGRLYLPSRLDETGSASSEAVRLLVPPPPGPLVEGESVSGIEPQAATLNATINPENNDTTYHFEYGTSASYGASVPVPDADIGSGFENHAVSAAISGLSVSTTYHYRVVATDSKGRVSDGPDQTFTTLPAVGIEDESASEITSGSATLQADLNPFGTDTTYRFEYGTTTAYGENAPVPDGDAGASRTVVTVSVHVQDLQPGTTYHFRVVAENARGSVQGEDRVFTTQAAGGRFALLDGRGWEMVSPPDKQGAALWPINGDGAVIQAAVDGSGISYAALAPTETNPPGNRAIEHTQLLSKRTPAGWRTSDITTPNDETAFIAVGNPSEYRLFSPNLSLGLFEPRTATKLSEEAVALRYAPYVRHDDTCEADPATCYQPLLTNADLPPETKFTNPPEAMTATPDLSHILVESFTPLTPGLPNNGLPGVYEWSGGSFSLVSILPDGKPAAEEEMVAEVAGERHRTGAVSADGSRVVFQANDRKEASAQPHLYLRDMGRGETVQVDAVEPGARGGRNTRSRFDAASSDGSRVFFRDEARLTADSTASPSEGLRDLYEFDLGTGRLTDLTVDANQGEHADVVGVVQGASRDGSYVYFVANGVLAPGAAPGHCFHVEASGSTCNLYVRHDGTTTFIGSLSYRDQQWSEEGESKEFNRVTARVSPDGRWFAFMSERSLTGSERSLTGYDNRDANSGERDEEVFLYDALAKRLTCVSCDPTGARPVGLLIAQSTLLVDFNGIWRDRWLAGSIPGWTPLNVGGYTLYQSRYLSDGGRMFFDSNDALVPQDVNGTEDVYEYEPEGVGDCSSASAGFRETLGGCVGLVSSGGSADESVFMDASENGSDVFFLTASKLLPQDFENALDLYDAHVCSNSSPCLPVPPATPPPCTTGDSCKPAPSPQPTVFGPPPSATFSGVGNFTALPQAATSPRSLTRAQRLARALRACQHKRSKRKRAACERKAHRRYAAKAAGKRSAVNTRALVSSIASGR